LSDDYIFHYMLPRITDVTGMFLNSLLFPYVSVRMFLLVSSFKYIYVSAGSNFQNFWGF